MAISIVKGLSGKYFSCSIPDVEFSISGVSADVTIAVDGTDIFNETLFPVGGIIKLRDLGNLITPYARHSLVVELSLTIQENFSDGRLAQSETMSATVIYCTADFSTNGEPVDAASFCDSHFLSIMLGSKVTSKGRLEFLHYLGNAAASVIAVYADGITAIFTPPKVQGNSKYTTIDVSPDRFISPDKTLVAFSVLAGARRQEYVMDLDVPDCAPVLIFDNSFGCQELVYCTGIHKVAPTYKRSNIYIEGMLRNYDIEETRTFKADTGVLNVAMANWLDDLFRSSNVRVVNFYNGTPNIGKEITISDSKSEVSNDDADMPRFTFSYQYAQHNHNVVDLNRAGRIFDNTFDNTFN